MLPGGPVYVLGCEYFTDPCRNKRRSHNGTAGGTQATEGHKAHGHQTQGQNKLTIKFSVPGRVERLPAVGHTIVLAFSSSLTGTVGLFCSHPMRINIWLCVSIVKVRLGDHGRGQLV